MKKSILPVLFMLLCTITVSATSIQIKASSDELELGETFGDVVASFTNTEIEELIGGTITTQGSTNYRQYIRFSGLSYPTVAYQKDENNVVSDFLYIPRNTGPSNAFFEYELEFEDGLESSIDSDDNLKDLDGEIIHIFNQPLTVTLATKKSNKIKIQMTGGATSDFVEEKQTKQFSTKDGIYDIEVLSIEDNTKKVKMVVNGETLPDLEKGEIHTLSDGKFIGVTRVLTSGGGTTQDMVEVFVGARVITFTDNNYKDNKFEENVKIDKQKIQGAYVDIQASDVSSTVVEITKIKYRLTSSKDIYVPKDEKLSNHMVESVALLANWDLRYEGLSAPPTNTITFTPSSSDDEYTISFDNKNSNSFSNIPFISNKGGTFKLGNSNNDLIIEENVNIDQNDYFIITSGNTKTGSTYVLRYNSIDTSKNQIKVYDYASGSEKTIVYTNSTVPGEIGTAEINVGTVKANTTILSSSGNPLNVDLNTDGDITTDLVYIITEDGGILVLESLAGTTYDISLRTESNQFEENSTEENIQFTIEARSGNKIGIQSTFSGITTQTSEGDTLGLSNYGVSMTYDDLGGTEAETFSFNYPSKQQFAEVFIDIGASEFSKWAQPTTTITETTCSNGIQDGDETGIDCGGSCPACDVETATVVPTCTDEIQNQGELGVDCGGPCTVCPKLLDEKCSNGCVYIGQDGLEICMRVGDTTETLYCASDYQIKLKKSNKIACTAGYECKVSICEEGVCGKKITPLSLSLNIIAILAFLIIIYYILKCLVDRE
jgi:hypothetical protein